MIDKDHINGTTFCEKKKRMPKNALMGSRWS